jgi:hypothetical protein
MMVCVAFDIADIRESLPIIYVAQPPQIDESTLVAMQQHMAQQAAFAQIPDVVKRVSHTAFFLFFVAI